MSDIEPASVTRTRTAHKHTRARARAGRMLRLGCARSISCGLRAFVPPQECAKFGAVDRVVIPRPPKSVFFLLHGRTKSHPLLAWRCRRCRRCRASTVWFSRTVLHSAWMALGRLSSAWVLPTLAFLSAMHKAVASCARRRLGSGQACARACCLALMAASLQKAHTVALMAASFQKAHTATATKTVTLSGKAFVRFLSVEGASKALLGIHGRRFASRENRHPRADTDACAYANNAATKPSSASRPTLPRADSPSAPLGSLCFLLFAIAGCCCMLHLFLPHSFDKITATFLTESDWKAVCS